MKKDSKLTYDSVLSTVNPIEDAINKGESELDFYLSEVTKEQFILDVEDLKKRYANKRAIEGAIEQLQKLL
jgi:hypothetical protein